MSTPHAPPHLVSAGAGSGKTYWIVERVVERVRAGTPLDRIAVVTFTKAAAAELQDRIRARLIDAGRLEAAARVDAAAICTIHQFALAVLRRYPLAAGLPPEPVVLEEVQSRTLLSRCIADWLRTTLAQDAPALRALLHEGLGPGLGLSERGRDAAQTPSGRLEELVRRAIEKARSVGLRAEGLRAEGDAAAARLLEALGNAGDATVLRGRFERALGAALEYVAANKEPKKGDRDVYALLAGVGEEDEGEQAWLELALRLAKLGEGAVTKGFAPGGALIDAAGEVALAHPAVRERLARATRGVFEAASEVLARFEHDKARIGALDFEDMQVLALELLTGRGPAGVPYGPLVAQTFRWVVVDEFQDTSPLQFRLFEELRAHGSEITYVGDLKQGIYGFRTADSALFAALLEQARARGKSPEVLSASRRSRPELVAFANDLFGAALPARAIPFEPLAADNAYSKGACPKDRPSLELLVHPVTNQGATKGAKQRGLIDRLESLVRTGALTVLDRATGSPRPARWGDVAILARQNDTLSAWSAALRARGIPTLIEEGELFETVEARLALAWLRMLASPRDSAAAASVLLSELYGVGQRTMARMAVLGLLGSPARALELSARDAASLPLTALERRALRRCADDLTECRRALRHLPLSEAVETVFEHVDLALRLAVKADAARAAQIRGNLRRFCELAQSLCAQPERPLDLHGATGTTPENLLLALERAREAHYTQRAGDEDADAVRLVTVHGSKGLEYPVVVLDGLDREFKLRTPRLEVARPDEPDVLLGPELLAKSGVRLVPEVGFRALGEKLEGLFEHEHGERQELLRLMYVAVTRAREHLILLWPADPKKASATERVRNVLFGGVSQPPQAAGEAGWVLVPGGAEHRVWVTQATTGTGEQDEAPEDTPLAAPLAELRARLEADAPVGPPVLPSRPERAPRLGVVAPTELCRAADCPEVPRLAVLYPHEHKLARLAGVAVDVVPIPSARAERLALGERFDPADLGTLLHQTIEHADLALPADAQRATLSALLTRRGAHTPEALAFLTRALDSVRAAFAALGMPAVLGREVPFAVDLEGLVLHGSVDLVARGPDGLHILDLKTHLLERDGLERWAGYYAPQLDAYALALSQLTGDPVAGRHLVLPSSGLLATLPGRFDPVAARARALALAGQLAAETPGPGPQNDCARCDWRALCRVAREALAERPKAAADAAE